VRIMNIVRPRCVALTLCSSSFRCPVAIRVPAIGAVVPTGNSDEANLELYKPIRCREKKIRCGNYISNSQHTVQPPPLSKPETEFYEKNNGALSPPFEKVINSNR